MVRHLIRLSGAVVVGAALVIGYATVRIVQAGERDDQRPSDAIVVLGAAQYDGRPSPVFKARLDHAVALYLSGFAKTFVVTGGKAPGDRTTEAGAARAYAIAHGVPASAILVEDRGRTTLESLRAVATLYREHGFRTGLFVSDRTHMLRVLRMATDLGIVARGSPTPSSPTDRELGRRIDATVHELGALGVYFVTGDVPVGPLEPPHTAP